MSKPISILEVIKKGGFEASIITTFNINFPFYEEVVLRKLYSAGCRYNVVLMDGNQCSLAWSSESSRPRLSGISYTTLPIKVNGAFHPKVCILIGAKKASILVGSHNLTLSGFGYNREITNWVEITGAKDKEGVAILSQAWQAVKKWIELSRNQVPDSLLESAYAIGNFIAPLISVDSELKDTIFLSQIPGEQSLLRQLANSVPENIKRIATLGPFFDADFLFLKELSRLWPDAEVVVGIDSDSVHMVGDPRLLNVRFVDVKDLFKPEADKYLHAKILYLESTEGGHYYLSGSANPSSPAWLDFPNAFNVEAMLLRQGEAARDIAEKTQMAELCDLTAVENETFEKIIQRIKANPQESFDSSTPLIVGVADDVSGVLSFSIANTAINFDVIELCGYDEFNILSSVLFTAEGLAEVVVNLGSNLHRASLCRLIFNDALVGRIMIHHKDAILASSKSSKQTQIRTALLQLGSSEADISIVIASVEKVIFSDDVHREVTRSIQERNSDNSDSQFKLPETLAVSVVDLPKNKKKQSILKSGDLAYLLDILIRKLGEGLDVNPISTDPKQRTEEEQIGADDDTTEEDESKQATTTLTDQQIAVAVASRARELIKKMLARLEQALIEKDFQVTAVFQLIAVIGLIRELRHLDSRPRWKMTGKPLVSVTDREKLFNQSLKYLLGKSQLLYKVESPHDSPTDEGFRLKILLLWLSWDLGYEISNQVTRLWEKADRDSQLQKNAFFAELLPPLIKDEETKSELNKSIFHTMKQTPKAKISADNWIDKHWKFAQEWMNLGKSENSIKIGDFCVVPNLIERPRVVLEIPNGNVSIWDFDRIRQFEPSRVKLWGPPTDVHDEHPFT